MLKLGGYPVSNFYNKARLLLLEKGAEFSEVRAAPSRTDADFLAKSPAGKIPYLELEDGRTIFESGPIAEYLEARFPEPPLIPRDPFEAARCREAMILIDWYLDGAARPLYGMVLRGSEKDRRPEEEIQKRYDDACFAARALASVIQCDPWLLGADYSAADAAAHCTLPLVGQTFAQVGPGNPLEEAPGLMECLARIAERPASKKIDRAVRAAQRAGIIGKPQG